MPRKASPLSSLSIGNFTWGYIFIHHMICFLLGASFYFVNICLKLFRIMFYIFFFNKNFKDSLYHAYFASIHVVVWKQKVYRCCKNSLENSENGIMLNLFAYWDLINSDSCVSFPKGVENKDDCGKIKKQRLKSYKTLQEKHISCGE